VVAAASGRVLEVGVGSGLNFPLYGKQVETVVGIDPSPRLIAIARRRADAAGVRTELLQGTATDIPLADSTIDTVVMTWTLCSIPDPLIALREMRRVLKPDGKLLCRTWAFTPAGDRALATQTYPHLAPCCRRLSSGSEDGRPYSLCRLRSD
jgi:ubiquinone/menaquinone biosynthesis C-methylase UbiE